MELLIDGALVAMGIAIGHYFPDAWSYMTSWFRKAPKA